jgi:hypothetical protein
MGQFPSMKAKRLLAVLERKPLAYRVTLIRDVGLVEDEARKLL